ncbi:hypothetical protein GGR54DRAFT_653420 [Hypoxylon sp. NC1633]|nr:hypothetical protein GGR54DRAFT_653420 [Hypoxylon sp. NC1633]
MSSSTNLSRTRSSRKPATGGNDSSQKDGPSTRSEARNTSPSRLPVKPSMTTRSAAANATASSSTATSRTRAPSSTTGRPFSGIYNKPVSTRPDHASNGIPKPLGRIPSTRQAPSSTAGSLASTSRSANTTTGRPKSSGGPPPTASNRLMGHSRSKSTVTSLTAATTLRPVSQVSSASSGRTSPTASTTTTTSSKPQTRSQTHALHARAKSISQSATASSASNGPSHPPAHHRPAFNNHQQHYSPAKSLAPKPLTSTFLAPPSPSKLPANVALSAETSRLQTELLQLSLLHRDAAAVDAEWHTSARTKLGARFAALAADDSALCALERRGVEARNVAALARWGDGPKPEPEPGLGLLEERVQVLDEALNGVWQLGEPGGRYARVVAGFEDWAARMADIVSAQRRGDLDALIASNGNSDGEGEEVRFLADLDRGWKRDCAGLQRKLGGWQAALRGLGDVDSDPDADLGLARMVSGCRALVRDMLAELAVMEHIERDAARAEDEWIESMNKGIGDEAEDADADADASGVRAYVPLWKLAA